ncbi:MAG: RagB/SusD family nutrient uptake outer membrane protein [Dysgonamonadaceae bacterium]|jgi:hypothetical protein|nr:RagB/SusD family nutrient uptake outer membrane protein [Dysgonamonadaceae bacterium]
MKKIKYYIASILLALSCGACNDWLDVDPYDKMLEGKQYSTEDNINSALNGLYRQMAGENLYGGQLSQTSLELMAHYYVYATNGVPGTAAPVPHYYFSIHEYGHGEIESRTGAIWTNAYKTLLNINNFIKGVNESKAIISANHKNVLLGEAYALRAYIHFDLYRLFCPREPQATDKVLPYSISPEATLNQADYENKVYRTSAEFITLLKADIQQAEQLLQANDPILDPALEEDCISDNLQSDFYKNRNRRINYYALMGLKARVLQYTGDATAAAAAAKVITDKIEADQVFHWINPNNVETYKNYIFFSEVIFGVNNPDFRSRGTNYYGKTTFAGGAYAVNKKNLAKNIFATYTEGNPDPSLGSIADVRIKQWTEASILPDGTGTFVTDVAYVSHKYKVDAASAEGYIPAVVDLQVLMRIPEMYYIQAEAALDAGDTASAIDLLNKVLAKRVTSSQYLLQPGTSATEIRDRITGEYYREFSGEGQVFFYHKRLQSEKMFNGIAEGTNTISKSEYTVPIPKAETDADF